MPSLKNKIIKCPKCGDENVYIGAFSIECGSDPSCENYTEQQAEENEKEKNFDEFLEETPYGFPYVYSDDDFDDFYF